MNILYITPYMNIGGAEQYVINKSNSMMAKGNNVIVISAGGEWITKLTDLGIKHITLDWINKSPELVNKIDTLKNIKILTDIINENKIDIVETNQFYCGVWTHYACEFTNTPYILNVLSELGGWKRYNHIEFYKAMDDKNRYYNLGAKSNSEIEINSGVKLKNCINIPIPIIIDDKTIIDDDNYILTVARMSEEKMYIRKLIDDYYKLYSDGYLNNDMKLVIVGDGPLFEEIQDKVSNINHIVGNKIIDMKGFVTGKELQKLYANCTLYVGMGTTLLTAVSYKKPSLISSFYEQDKCYGYFEPDGDDYSFGQPIKEKEGSFYEYILKVIQDRELYEQLSANSFEYIKDKFALDSVMEKWETEYKKNSNMSNIGNELYFEMTKIKVFKLLRHVKHTLKRIKE